MVNYKYYPNGLTKSSTPEGGQALTMKYNPQGKRTLLADPDGGTVRTEYNGWGELTKEVQLIHMNKDSIITLNNYDSFGRLLNINRNNEITTYTYDTNNKSRVNSIAISGKNTQTFDFDDLDRVKSVTETITANGKTKTFFTGKEYDALGRIKKETYPSGYYTVNSYDQYSNLTEVKDGAGHSIWKASIENAFGQATNIFKGTKETRYEYDPVNHLKTSIKATGIIDYTYGYDSKNNLSWRKDNQTTQQEDFGYDELNRLTSWKVTRTGIQTSYGITYDPTNPANIQTKSGIETDPQHLLTMFYGGKNPDGSITGRPDTNNSAIGPHALSGIQNLPSLPFPQTDLTVTYTDFKKIATLHEGTKDYELTYGVDDQRRMSVYYANGKSQGTPTLTRYYLGDYEEEIGPDNKVRKIHYLSGAILIQNEGKVDSLLYTYSDAQGSLIALTDANGVLVRRYAYDPWGSRRDADNWNAKDNGDHLIVNRGYTGHEHLDAFGIINMNGRVYDPATAQFFSPDPYVQAPGDWLNYNRYSYCSGNPFRYTDPSGNLQIGPFYISINIGWSAQGGFSFGISAGIGLENAASVGVSIGFGAKYGNLSFSINGSLGGGYAYVGYDTQGGWTAGAGYSFISPFSVWSPVSVNTNMYSVGLDYSENGGVSGNYMGMSINSEGMSYNPSIGVSATGQWGLNISENDVNIGIVQKDKAKIKTNEELLAYCKEHNIDPKDYNANSVDIENDLPKALKERGYIRQNGIIYKMENGAWVEVGGFTASYLKGFKEPTSSIFMSTHDTYEHFQISLNHEFIHSWQWANYGYKMSGKDWDSYKEYSAYSYTKMYYPNINVPSYYGPLNLSIPSLPYVPTLY